MKSTFKFLAVSAFALLISIPAAYAQTMEQSTLTVAEPLDVGGTMLQPGTYTIRVMPSGVDRNKVQILSTDLQTVHATVLTVPHPLEPGEEIPNTTFVFYPAGDGAPRALRTWFAGNPPTLVGHDIVYPESRARQLARLADSRVVFYPGETIETESSLQVVTPEATVETYSVPVTSSTETTTTEQTTAMTSGTTDTTDTTEMPATAGNGPMIALLGLLSIACAAGLRFAR